MNWTSIIKISLFVGAVHMAAAVPNDLLHTNELGSVKNKVDGAYDNSEASGAGATLDLLEEVKDAVSSPRGLRGVDAGGLFNGDNMPHNENAKNRYRSKLTEPPVNATVVENEYIVVLEESVADVGAKMGVLLRVVNRLGGLGSEAEGFGSLWNINDRFKGQAVKMTHEQAEMMSELNGVRYIEHNTELVDQSRLENEGGSDDIDMASHTNLDATDDPFPWNLDRIDQRSPKLDQTYNPTNNGTGVLVIILDDGIRETHEQFKDADGKSRVVNSDRELIPRRQRDCTVSRPTAALNSGTSAAAIVGGNTFGVAKEVSLVDIRGSCGSDPTSTKDYYIEVLNHIGGVKPKSQERIVVNGGFVFSSDDVQNSVQEALSRMIDEDRNTGVVFVTKAGDGRETNKCTDTHFPANLDEVISVGATQLDTVTIGRERKQDGVYSRTNTACADIYAPGVNIKLAKANSDTASSDKRDASTAYAAPHVTGAVAMILQEAGFKDKTPKEVKAELIRRSAIETVGDLEINYVHVGGRGK